MERLGAAKKDPKNQDPTKQFAIEQAEHILRAAHVKDPGPKQPVGNSRQTREGPSTPELDLGTEWQRQASNFVKHGYHTELNLTEEAYLASLPRFEPQQGEYRGVYDRPLLVEKRISWERQAELAGIAISDYLRERLEQAQPWEGNPNKAPEDQPYTAWFSKWDQRFPNKIRPTDARVQLTLQESGADPFEGVAQEIHHPEDTEGGRYFDLIGFSVESDLVVYLRRWDGQPELIALWYDFASDDFRPLVRGSKIVTG